MALSRFPTNLEKLVSLRCRALSARRAHCPLSSLRVRTIGEITVVRCVEELTCRAAAEKLVFSFSVVECLEEELDALLELVR